MEKSKTIKANTTFSLDLFKKLSNEDKTANIFYSPFSISSALAMVMLGTRGNTAIQMSQVLGFTEKEEPMEMGLGLEQTRSPMQAQMMTRRRMRMQMKQTNNLPDYLCKLLKTRNSEDDVHACFRQLLGELHERDAPYALSIANRLYGEQSYQFCECFLAETKQHYNAELVPVDFKTSAEAARVDINTWVEDQTQGKIKDLLAQGVLDDMTKLVLVNAIYFKGNWYKKFEEDSTTTDVQFKVNKKDTKPVTMMRQKSNFRVASIPEVKCQILEMFYEGKELSMLIFLPDEIEDDTTGLEKLESELTYDKFDTWTGKDMTDKEVDVMLPRFKMEVTYALKDVLTSMGMVDAFDVSKSNFSGMSPANDLFLTKVIHKAFIEVNEEGTEAAAATAAVISTRSIKIPVIFKADHPFLFFIRHNSTKSILFAGRYSSPE